MLLHLSPRRPRLTAFPDCIALWSWRLRLFAVPSFPFAIRPSLFHPPPSAAVGVFHLIPNAHFFHLKEAETATYWGKNPVFYMIWFPIQTNAMSFLPDSRGGCVTTDNFSSSFGFSDWVLNT
jgi:hypothetical protein